MKKILLCSVAILLTALISIVLFSYITGDPTYPRSVIQAKLYSKILNEERQVIIHLPRHYDKSIKYPVMYVLDGSSQDKHIAAKFDILSSAGYVSPTIIVGLPNVSGKGRQRDYTPPNMRMDIDEENSPLGEGDRFLTFMEKELIPFIENKFSVSKTRSFAGNSRGALLVMYSLLYKPGLFQGRFCFSPAFWRDDDLIVKKVSAVLTANKNLNSFLYMSMGDKENDKMKNAFDEMKRVFSVKADEQLVWYLDYTKNADHRNNAEISASVGIRKWTDYINEERLMINK